jgi:hypothetical protein
MTGQAHRVTGGLLVAIRVVAGMTFVISGAMKFRDPESLALAIRGFEVGVPEALLPSLTYTLPWTELLAGALLTAGWWSRPAAWVVLALTAIFLVAILSLLVRDLAVTCPCFGSLDVFCTGALGWCHILRDLALLTLTAIWLRYG